MPNRPSIWHFCWPNCSRKSEGVARRRCRRPPGFDRRSFQAVLVLVLPWRCRGSVRLAAEQRNLRAGGDIMKCHFWQPAKLAFALAAFPILTTAASAQIAVSANDNKAVLVNGVNAVPANPSPDTVTIIDLSAKPPKVIGELQAPTSVVGPPNSVAVSRDESFALVTGAMKLDPADPKKLSPDNKL